MSIGQPYVQPQGGQVQAAPYTPVLPPKRRYTGLQKLLAITVLLLAYFYVRMFLFSVSGLGRTLFVWLLLAVSAVYMARCKIRPNAAAVVSGVLTGAFALVFLWIPSDMLTFCTAVFCQLAYTYGVYKTMDTRIERFPGRFFDFDLIKAFFAAPFASFGALFPALFTAPAGATGKSKTLRRIGFVLLGLLLSVIPTAIAVSLLSFDQNFRAILDGLFTVQLSGFEFAEQLIYILLAIPVAMYIFGLWMSGERGACAGMNAESCCRVRARARFLPGTVALAAAVPLLLVYLLFFIAQFSYFTSAFAGVLPASYSHAEYARRGFFELCAVIVLNGGFVYLLWLFAKRSAKAVWLRICIALFCVSSLVLTATAVSKMLLYVEAFGLTLSRVYTLWFMLAVALVFLLLLARMVWRRLPFVAAALAVCLVMFGALAFSNAPALVSGFNTSRVRAGADWMLDENYFNQLGASAVSDAVLLESDPNVQYVTRSNARRFLDSYAQREPEDNFLRFNFTEYRAQQALSERKPQG